ncbi:MAG: radical SAM protein [Ignavibacteriaceae bacterium]
MFDDINIKNEEQAQISESHYKNCIDFQEIDLSVGCNVGCIYCGLAVKKNESITLSIDNIINYQKPKKGIYLSPNSDPFYYNVADKTHQLLEHFLPQGVPFLLITKSIIPDKTIKLISNYPELVIPQISLARLDQKLNDYIEPNAARVTERLDTIRNLADAGLRVTALMMPVYHTIDDTEDKLLNIIHEFAKYGASIVRASYVLIRNGDKPKDKEILDKMKQHEKLKKCLEQMTEKIQPHIGEAITFPFEKRISFYKKIAAMCEQNGIKFSACSVLDPNIFADKSKEFVKCKCVWNFRKSQKVVYELENIFL